MNAFLKCTYSKFILFRTVLQHCLTLIVFLRLYERSKSHGVKCLPTFLTSHINLSRVDIELCTTWKEEVEIKAKFVTMLNADILNLCPTSCNKTQYNGKMTFWKGFKKDGNTISIKYSFPSNQVQVFEEYLMFGLNDLIGTIGGHSGLFIGFSFYGFFSQIIDFIKRHLD